MKRYKILVNSKNSALVMDFIQHTGGYFKTLSTTGYMPDIIGHFEMFKPDAYVCFVDFEYEKTLAQIGTLRNESCYNGAAVIIIGDSDTCDMIEETSKYAANLIIRRPISQDNLTLMMTHYFEKMEERRAKADAEARKAAEARTTTQAAEAIKAANAARAANAANAVNAAEAAAAQAPSGKKNVLIVDDDRTVLKMLKAALEDKYNITTMANGTIVEKFLETKKTDLIVLDYEMPGETGADVFRKLKKNPRTSHIPVCFLTGVSEREKVMEIIALNPHGYLIKPIDMDMLTATISNLTK